jgi:uncharacterized membrane protein YdcZ (DUF606 family)
MQGTLYNYITGLMTAIVIMLLLGRQEPVWTGLSQMPDPLLFLGGWMGVAVVALTNVSVHRVSSLYLTLFQFIGQVAAGIVVDTLLSGGVAWQNVAGGGCIAVGLLLNTLIEQRKKTQTQT